MIIISIHALREEGDRAAERNNTWQQNFYPRPPRGGRHDVLVEFRDGSKFLSTPSARRATQYNEAAASYFVFLSTPSARRATVPQGGWFPASSDFYPRPPRGGRPRPSPCSPSTSNFYPRPPRGGRPAGKCFNYNIPKFLSTPSARRATHYKYTTHILTAQFLSTPSARRATTKDAPKVS